MTLVNFLIILSTINIPLDLVLQMQLYLTTLFTNNISSDYAGILIDDISDHLPVFYITKSSAPNHVNSKYTTKCYRDINETNINKFVHAIKDLQWNHCMTSSNADNAYNNFLKDFGEAYDECFPYKNNKIRLPMASTKLGYH